MRKVTYRPEYVENGIDVVNSKAAINAIIASEKISFDGKSISNIDDLDKYYEKYAELYNHDKYPLENLHVSKLLPVKTDSNLIGYSI